MGSDTVFIYLPGFDFVSKQPGQCRAAVKAHLVEKSNLPSKHQTNFMCTLHALYVAVIVNLHMTSLKCELLGQRVYSYFA